MTAAYAGRARAEAATARAAAMAAIGVTPEYVAQMRAVGHALPHSTSPSLRRCARSGLRPNSPATLFASGFPGDRRGRSGSGAGRRTYGRYVRAMRSAGVRGDFDDFIQLRAVGIDPGFAARARKSGMTNPTADDLVELQHGGLPRPPVPPAPPKVRPEAGTRPTPTRTADAPATAEQPTASQVFQRPSRANGRALPRLKGDRP